MSHEITYNTIVLARQLNSLQFSLYLEGFLTFLDYILTLAKARDKMNSKKARTFEIHFCPKTL